MNQLQQRNKRRMRIRAKIKGTGSRPRLSIFRSNTHIFAQVIDDEKGVTLVSSNTKTIKSEKKATKSQKAFAVGEEIAKRAKTAKIESVVFDRGGYRYHGRVAQVAEGARKGGLNL